MEAVLTESLCRISINWTNFRSNTAKLMEGGRTLMPVIKADAYGHGVLQASRELSALGIGWVAVGTLEEGVLVRKHGFEGNIVALLSTIMDPPSLLMARKNRIVPLVHSWAFLRALIESLRGTEDTAPMDIAVKVDTGMGRLGFRPEEMEEVAKTLQEQPVLRPLIQISHFSVADEDGEDDYTQAQAERFYAAADTMRRFFPDMECSLGNTAGLLHHHLLCPGIYRPASPSTAAILSTVPRAKRQGVVFCPSWKFRPLF